MVFLETSVFTRRVTQRLTAEKYRLLQNELVARPEAGDIIRRGGGIRKLRWAIAGKGKSGGVRCIYYWANAHNQILMLFIFGKNEADDLTDKQLQQLRAVEVEYP